MRNFVHGKTAGVIAALFVFGSMTAFATSSLVNISTRMQVQTGDNVLIGGFIVTGTGQKKILVRAMGPSLPVSGALSDPILELHDASGHLISSNDNWRTSQQDQIIATHLAPNNDKESAILATVNPGAYTAVVKGVNNAIGVGLVEVYDLDGTGAPTRLSNISTRGDVLTDDNVMIGGFIIHGDIAKRVIIRVDGPTLILNGVPIAGRLMDPTLELHDSTGALIAQNDNWRSSQQAEIQASTFAPSDDREPALIATLPPGNYTAIVRGVSNSTGVALIEMYDLDEPPQPDGSTLYIAQLRPENGVTSGGSGTATLRMSGDETSAVVAFEYSNLSSPVTGIAIYSDTGQLLFDVSASMAQPDGTYNWIFAPRGTYSVADIIAAIKSGKISFIIQTSSHPAGELSGSFNLSSGGQSAPIPTPPPALASGTPSPADAGRFLSQSTFGPSDELITKVQNEGFTAFLNEQFATAATSQLAFVNASGVNPLTNTQTLDAWWTTATTAPDQLRQRVAFALSEIMVVSINSANLGDQPAGMSNYMDVLARDAFGNYRQLLEDVTLNPVMGQYLDMLHNDKANAAQGTHPNENYAREIMQLFSVGLYRLNLDDSLTLNAQGFPLNTYSQDAVLGLAAVFTGWNFAQTGTPVWNGATPNYINPMIPFANHHEPAQKKILDGVTTPANQTAQQDLKTALDTIFNDPNVGPFFCRQLIQRLVTSNPGPGYIYRVASVFNDNGHGVRGDLTAVVRAILMDYDARGNSKTDQGYGHEREPDIRLTNLLRAFHASTPDGKFSVSGGSALGQLPLHAPTVFNFFSPDYESPGTIAQAGLKSPEFQITTETTVIAIANFLRNAIYSGLGPSADRITLDLSNEITLASNPTQLVDHLNALLMNGGMSSSMRTTLINAVTQIPASNPTERAHTAVYLVINSPEFTVQK